PARPCGAKARVDLPGHLDPANPLGRHHDVDLRIGHLEVAVNDDVRIHAEVGEQLTDHACIRAEAPGYLMDVLESIAAVVGDAEMIGAEQTEGIDTVALTETHGGQVFQSRSRDSTGLWPARNRVTPRWYGA